MKLSEAIEFEKNYFRTTDTALAETLQISRPQLLKIKNGYTDGLSAKTLRRLSRHFRLSIDELLDNRVMTPIYHHPKIIHNTSIKANKDYAELAILSNDTLYVRPFFPSNEKIDQLIVVAIGRDYSLKRFQSLDQDWGGIPIYEVVGISRINDAL